MPICPLLFFAQGKPKKNRDAVLVGLAVGNRLIPESFAGTIEWGYVENRPFLRALQGAIFAYVQLRRHQDAVTLMDTLLAYNPNDNQGCRYLLGSEVWRMGDTVRAQRLFTEYAPSFPPYYYELALLHMANQDWLSAATALRQGFCTDTSIADMLCGQFNPQGVIFGHDSDGGPEIATDYIEMYGDSWWRRPDALAFVYWLYHHSSVMLERVSRMKCQEDLLAAHDVDTRRDIIDRQRRLFAAIGSRLSAMIVKKVKNRQGVDIWPWAHNSTP